MQIMAEIKIRTEEILLQCRYAGVISLSGPRPSSEDRGGGQGGVEFLRNYPSGWSGWFYSTPAVDTCFGKHAIA